MQYFGGRSRICIEKMFVLTVVVCSSCTCKEYLDFLLKWGERLGVLVGNSGEVALV